MKLIYLDEAGATGTRANPSQPIHLLAAIVVDENQVRPVEDDLRTLGYKYFGAKSGDTNFEFRGYDIYHGNGYFAGMKPESRITLVDELLGIIEKHAITFGYSAINKQRSSASLHPHQLAFLFLVERLEDRLVSDGSLGLIIADEHHDMEQRLIDDLEVFKTASTRFGWRPTKIEHIVDSVHFVQSKNNRLIQLADVVAAVTYRGILTHSNLDERFAAETDASLKWPIMLWPAWIEQFASAKQKANLRLWQRLQQSCRFAKIFP